MEQSKQCRTKLGRIKLEIFRFCPIGIEIWCCTTLHTGWAFILVFYTELSAIKLSNIKAHPVCDDNTIPTRKLILNLFRA